MSTCRKGYLVTGRVQGVGFRWWTRRSAEALGLAGTVRNENDGSVLVMAAGEEAVVERFRAELEKGPPFARVDSISEIACVLDDRIEGFRIL